MLETCKDRECVRCGGHEPGPLCPLTSGDQTGQGPGLCSDIHHCSKLVAECG